MTAKKIFTVSCIHQYFNNGQCSDLQIEPTASCNIVMKRFKLQYKQDEASTYSVYLIQPGSIKIPLPSLLSFYIFISNDAFFKYTQTPLVKTNPANNDDGPANNIFLFSSTSPKAGAASFNAEKNPKPSPFLFQNRKLFGIINIIPPSEFCIYRLTLQATALKWRYYIVAYKSIEDVQVKESSLLENAADKITFKSIAAGAADNTYNSIKTLFPEAGIFVNESESEIPLAQKPGKKIQLWNATDKNNNLLLMDNLPLPSVQDSGQKVIYLRNTS